MVNCGFSEFSFGYALTDSLLTALGSGGVAPVFANQVVEGKPGGGYDMKLSLNPLPIFFQFKIPAVLSRSSVLKPPGYTCPYYRMHLRTKKPNQHSLLLDLQKTNPLVYYASPLFDQVAQLDLAFMTKTVHRSCLFVLPSDIGALDEKPHHLSYKHGFPTTVHSEPRVIEGAHDFDSLTQRLNQQAGLARASSDLERRADNGPIQDDRRREVLENIRTWLVENRMRDLSPGAASDHSLTRILSRQHESPAELVRDLGYVAQIHYGLTLAFVDAGNPPLK